MQPLLVSHYQAKWNAHHHSGTIILISQGVEYPLPAMQAPEFHALIDLLRNERPIYFDPTHGDIFTRNEMVGEEEMD